MSKVDQFIYCIVNYGRIQNFIISNKTKNIDKLRKFHNFIKYNLIIDNCSSINANNLLDIACGRGGDLQKWLNKKLNLKYILAFDSHKDSIYSSLNKGGDFDGAIARFQNVKQNFKGRMPFINFKYLDILTEDAMYKLNQMDSDKIYDVVSCQFAMHYFCKNEETLNNTLNIISKKLRKGGLFIGTATDGDIIHNILEKGNVYIPLLTLVKQSVNNYLFYIQTNQDSKKLTRQNYFEIQGVSSEFYLFKEQLRILALKNGLELVQYKSFYDWYKIYKKTPIYNEMSIYEMLISFLNFSFIFKKI